MQPSQERLSQLSLATSSQKSTQMLERGRSRNEMPEVHHQHLHHHQLHHQQLHTRLPQLGTTRTGAGSKPISSSHSSLAFFPDKVPSCPSMAGSQYLAKSSKSGTKAEYLAQSPKSGAIADYLGNGSKSIADGESSSSPSSPFLSAPSSRLFIFYRHITCVTCLVSRVQSLAVFFNNV